MCSSSTALPAAISAAWDSAISTKSGLVRDLIRLEADGLDHLCPAIHFLVVERRHFLRRGRDRVQALAEQPLAGLRFEHGLGDRFLDLVDDLLARAARREDAVPL